MMNQHQRGFSLIELMVVVAIIGILVAVSGAAYKDFINRANVTSALADIAPAKVQTEIRINDGETSLTPALVGIGSTSPHCSTIAIAFDVSTGETEVKCTMQGTPDIKDRTIAVSRNTSGYWSCITGTAGGVAALEPQYVPKGCT
ncbi:pilin [Moraxellaceae bacterium AER2_44_116]|nr:pilin [Moraxellaceae bacterium]TQC95894.1 pilin [Moraxellaceae bacterium AER2_44_116]